MPEPRSGLTRDDVLTAKYVRDRFGWHRVLRVNPATVTVRTCYSWRGTDRIPFTELLELANTPTDPQEQP